MFSDDKKPMVLLLREISWYVHSFGSNGIQGYESVTPYYRQSHIGGGVSILVRYDTAPKVITVTTVADFVHELIEITEAAVLEYDGE